MILPISTKIKLKGWTKMYQLSSFWHWRPWEIRIPGLKYSKSMQDQNQLKLNTVSDKWHKKYNQTQEHNGEGCVALVQKS